MELILALVSMVNYLLVRPIWWIAERLAGIFYPFEGDNRHFTLSLLFLLVMIIALIVGLVAWME